MPEMVDYFSRQLNQKAKVTNKYYWEFVIATTTRIGDAIAKIDINSTPIDCQTQHFNKVNQTNFRRASYAQQTNIFNLLSALNTHELLLSTTVNAPQIQTTNSSKECTEFISAIP